MAVTAETFRRTALALPDVVEGEHQGHPDFRCGGRVMATLTADGKTGMVKVAPERQSALVAAAPDVWSPASGAWGRAGCTMVALARVSAAALKAAMTDAWEVAAAAAAKAGKRRR
jgi:hypothetical protein